MIALRFLIFVAALVAAQTGPSTAQDVQLTTDGKVPGKPFQVLQDQIDSLQTLSDLACAEGQTVRFTSGQWVCADVETGLQRLRTMTE